MPKYFITLSKSFSLELNGSEREAIDQAFSELLEGLTTGAIVKNDFEVDIWEDD